MGRSKFSGISWGGSAAASAGRCDPGVEKVWSLDDGFDGWGVVG